MRFLKKVLVFRATLWLGMPFLATGPLALEARTGEHEGMKEKIHPKYQDSTITCICGNVVHTRSTVKDMQVNTCSACHPFYTCTAKYVDAAGRVEQFKKRYGKK